MAKGQAEAALTANETVARIIRALLDPKNRPVVNAFTKGTLEIVFTPNDPAVTMRLITRTITDLAS